MGEMLASEHISQEVMALLGTECQVAPFSRRYSNFGLADAYDVVARVGRLRRARGEKTVGRKIGFTNRTIWGNLGIAAPIWNYVFDTTVRDAVAGHANVVLTGMPEPRIEPEVVLHLALPPAPGMTVCELLECIDWIAPAFEIVFSIFPNWEFTAADAAAAYGVHGALTVGDSLDVTEARAERALELRTFTVEMENDFGVRREGRACNVLGGPLEALKFLVEEISHHPACEPLAAGEIISTGTLTEAMPVRPGTTWRVRFQGIGFTSLQLSVS